MKLCSIASGSSGNCIFAGSETTSLLIDAGISGKRVEAGLAVLDRSAKELDGILVTLSIPIISRALACWRAGMVFRFTQRMEQFRRCSRRRALESSRRDFSHDSRG